MTAVALCCLLVSVTHAQTPAFKASVSSQRVPQNSVFDVRFELEDAAGDHFVPPAFVDFKVVGGPSRGSSTMIINGVVSRSESWSYSLLATHTGKFTIGPATIVAGRKKMSTEPITIEVIAARDIARSGTASKGEGVLLMAEVEDKPYYPGQQITLNYRLLFRENVQTVNVLSEDDYADFFVQPMGDFSKEPSVERIRGQDYTSRIIKSIALFPHQSGSYVIDPLIMDVGINAPFPGIQGFFTMNRIQDVRVASEPLTIRVLPLPDGAPPSFQGAVGHYQLATSGGQDQLSTDDALTFQVDIQGDGDSKRWDPPVPVRDSSYDVYPPKILVDKVEEKNGAIHHQRTLEYQVLPRQAGTFAVTVPFTYFDPDQQRYVTLSSDTIRVAVREGLNGRSGVASASDQAGDDSLMKVRSPWFSDRFWVSWPHLFLFGLIITGSALNLMVIYRRKKDRRVPESERIRQGAGKKAGDALDALQASSAQLDGKTFYEKATEIYYRFLSERMNIPPADLDVSRLPYYLSQGGLSPEDTAKAVTLFDQSLVVRYGGIPAGYTREELIRAIRDIIAAC